MTRLGLRDRARIGWTVWIVSVPLLDLPRRRRMPILRELRRNLRDAAREVGSREAITRLGSKKELADSYLTAAGPRSRWKLGAVWMVGAFTGWWLVHILISTGFIMGVKAAAPAAGDERYSWQTPWLGYGGFIEMTDGKPSAVGGDVNLLVPLIILLAAFVLGASRFWRKLPFVRPGPGSAGMPE